MPSTDFIPRRDADFRDWVVQYSKNISAAPSAFMMTVAQADFIKSAVDDFVAKYEIATNELTRTKTMIIAKQDARSVAEWICRSTARIIKSNKGIRDDTKVSIGVPPVNPKRIRQNCPQTSPILAILGNTSG